MKKKLLIMSLIALLAVSLTILGCGEVGPTPVELKLVFSDHNPEPVAAAQGLTAYMNYIVDHSGGKIEATIGYLGSIVPQQQVYEGLQAGTADCASYVPEIGDGIEYFQVMQMPFMGWGTAENARQIFWQLTDRYPQILAQFPSTLTFATLYMMPPVQIHYYAEDFVATTPDDIAGLELICLEGNLARILEILGATPMLLPFPDMLDGVSKGLGDGYVQHAEFLFGLGIKQFFNSHTAFPGGIVMTPIGALWNTESYNAVVDIVGEDVMEAAAAAYVTKFDQARAVDTAGIYEWWAGQGDTVTSLNAAQTAVWADAVADYVDEWENACDSPAVAKDIYESAKALIAAL